MNFKKGLVSVLTIIVFAVTFLFQANLSYATVATGSDIKTFGITELMEYNEPNWGYSIKDPTVATDSTAMKIWNIVEYIDDSNTTEANAFCLYAGKGFSESVKKANYNVYYDLASLKAEIDDNYPNISEAPDYIQTLYNALYNNNYTVDTETRTLDFNKYGAILAALDMFSMPSETDRREIIEKAKTLTRSYDAEDLTEEYELTDNEIVAIEQAVMWYFTNYGEGMTTANPVGRYDLTGERSWLKYTTNGSSYSSLSDYKESSEVGKARSEQAEGLYNYIITQAKANASKYVDANAGVPAKVNTTTLQYTESGSNYIVGPINITETEENIKPYTIEMTLTNNGSTISNYNLLDSNKSAVSSGTTVKDLVGNDFYISVPKSSAGALNVKLNIKYSDVKGTVWTSNNSSVATQPLLIPEREPVEVPVTLSMNQPLDLALRKYITKINDVNITNTRVPSIDESTLTSGTTATYKHRKDPVIVENGDKVTYKLTIYNEGQVAGRATKIVDQLPTGLKFNRVVSGNFELDEYTETNNTLKLKRVSGNNTNLPAYEQGKLEENSETIEIECEVTAVADSSNKKVLTNVAWISQAFDENNNEVDNGITDRDSQTTSSPSVNKDNMENYKGNTNNKDSLTDSNYYYEGQQDDDDFEKLVVLPEIFDLKLIKRITAVNTQNVTERINSVDVSGLNKVGTNGEFEATTAEYKMTKDPISVSKGDIVTYTLRVYNEGTIDGYASKITEDIPEGLEFLWSEKEGAELEADTNLTDAEKDAIAFNQEKLWGDFKFDTNNKITEISTDYLSKDKETTVGGNLITAFGRNDGTKTVSDLKYKEVSVKLRVVSDDASGKSIRNEAAITGHTDKDGNNVNLTDRDSQPENWNKENDTKYYDDNNKWPIYKQDDEDYDNIVLKIFDLSLRKFIIAVSKDTTIENSEYLKNNDGSYTRAPRVDTSKLNTIGTDGNKITTATYIHTKEPVEVKKGDIVIYNLRVYNEGNVDGYAAEIKDHLPSYLEFVEGQFNTTYGWSSTDGKTIKTEYLKDEKINKPTTGTDGNLVLSYKEVPIMCRVTDAAVTNEKITNIADITKYLDDNKQSVTDRDSQENNVDATEGNKPEYKDNETGEYIPGQQDDDDFEKVIIPKKVDLALTKFITAISTDSNIEDGEYLTPSKNIGSKTNPYDRQTAVNTKELRDNEDCHDATYVQVKTPLVIGANSYVLYNIRVYNEGEVDVYAGKVADYLPENLNFVDGEFNRQYGWTLGQDGRTVETTYLSSTNGTDKILKAFDKANDDGEGSGLDYKDLPILCQVSSSAPSGKKIINTAEITKYEDKDGNEIPKDIDSEPSNVNPKNQEERQQDDDDYEVVLIKKVDLALTKFITAISTDSNIEDGEYLTPSKNIGSKTNPYDRQTAVNTKELRDNEDCHDATYVQVKTPLLVGRNSYVLYNIRVYNEGTEDVYAGEVTDYLPANLDYVDGEFNNQYGWTLGEDGKTVKTSYLSSKNGTDKILKAFDKANDDGEGSGLDYKDLPILCQVNNNAENGKELINTAEITKYEDKDGEELPNDVDSTPENVETKNDKDREEDDDDYEVVVVKEFDLALRKWVTQAIVIENGKTSVTSTGHQPYDDPESVVKVELKRKKINSVTVKFRYSIRIINEGDIEGYAKEITDYVPEGLKFIAADNPGWTDEGNNVISTRLLENTLLQPGESADVEVILTWINNDNNMGVKTNIAEISEDYNEYGIPDRDSDPDNKVPGEDDIDDAPVMLSISTGRARMYIGLSLIVLITMAGGIVLIKKYVL